MASKQTLQALFANDPEMLALLSFKTQKEQETIERQLFVSKVFQGAQGEKGDTGLQGDPGTPGINGKDGRNGKDGSDGKNGKDGQDGKDGTDGTSAVLNVDEVFDTFIKRIVKEKPIDISNIRNAESFMYQGTRYKFSELMHGAGSGGGGGGGGFTLTEETPVGTVDASNNVFTVSNTPLYIIVDGSTRVAGQGYTYASGTITVDPLAPPVQWIRSYYNDATSTTAVLTAEVPVGAVNGSNVTYTVSNQPLYVVADGLTRVAGQGYTYAAGVITFDALIPPVQFVISYYNTT